jgi:hypothetical protein
MIFKAQGLGFRVYFKASSSNHFPSFFAHNSHTMGFIDFFAIVWCDVGIVRENMTLVQTICRNGEA